jgi:hypothetical protein
VFEDLEIGDTFVAGPRELSAVEASTHPATVAAEVAALWRDSGVQRDALVRHVRLDGSSLRTVPDAGELSLHTVVVRLAPHRDGTSGQVTWHHELRSGSGLVVYAGRTTDVLRADDAFARRTHRDVGTVAWGEELVALLASEPRFADAVATWDGAIGFRSGDRTVELRLYRGRVLEVTRRSPHGATFTFGTDDRTWADILTGTPAPFGVRLMRGDFDVSGDPYEYLRLTKALEIVVDTACVLAAPLVEAAR